MEMDFKKFPEHDHHFLVQEVNDDSVGLRGFISIHRQRGDFSSLGATRLWRYSSPDEALRDSMRLARLMSYKSALAGLPYGGAKAVLILPEEGIKDREAFFRAYAREVNNLAGRFVTGTDVGLTNEDLDFMKKESKHIIGQGVHSGYYTAIGIFSSLKLLNKKIHGVDDLAGRSFAIQGLGKTGLDLVKLLVAAGAQKIYASELNPAVIENIKKSFPEISIVSPDKIFEIPVDYVCPCALNGVINDYTINKMQCKAIAGSANNQLASPQMGHELHKRGIFYAPDYLVNAGGIISVVDQFINQIPDEKRILKQIEKIPVSLGMVYEQSVKNSEPPSIIADQIAEEVLKGATVLNYTS